MPGGASFLKAQGIPVVAPAINITPGEQPFTNFFADTGSLDPDLADYPTTTGTLLKQIGVTRLASIGEGANAGSVAVATATYKSAEYAGLQPGYLNTTAEVGQSNWTPFVLAMKAHHVNGLATSMDVTDNLNVSIAAKQEGLQLKALMANGYNAQLVQSPAVQEDQGLYVVSLFRPSELGGPAVDEMNSSLRKYEHYDQLARYDEERGYVTGLLAVEALEVGGQDPTRVGVLHNLRAVTSWTADGLEPRPVDFATVFGHNAVNFGNDDCVWVLRISGDKFVPVSAQPTCGTTISSK
jgi:ABC-type branched-subunit amino acid transport system substrate-binding protein